MGWSYHNKPPMGWPLDYDSGLVPEAGFWLFNEGSGGQVFDLSGNGTGCTFTNGPIWGTGPYDSQITFDGDDDYLLANKQPPSCLSQITIMWSGNINPHGTGDGWSRVVDWFDAPSIYRSAANRIGWYGDIAGVPVDTEISVSFFANGVQHICAVTFDGIDIKAYIDGVLDKTTNQPGALSVPSNTFCIGGRSTAQDRCLSGSLDWVMMWNRALSASEITLLHREPFCMFKDPDEIPLFDQYYDVAVAGGIMTTNTGYWGAL